MLPWASTSSHSTKEDTRSTTTDPAASDLAAVTPQDSQSRDSNWPANFLTGLVRTESAIVAYKPVAEFSSSWLVSEMRKQYLNEMRALNLTSTSKLSLFQFSQNNQHRLHTRLTINACASMSRLKAKWSLFITYCKSCIIFLTGSVDLLSAFGVGDQANVFLAPGKCGQIPDAEATVLEPIPDEHRPGYLVPRGLEMKRLLSDLLPATSESGLV